ncbi:MAG: esterase-like activity of phytase family protein [Pseudomonadales bacterium]|nr:esterase-like activity of phytase family protein [Pseudomonadales bacterium]
MLNKLQRPRVLQAALVCLILTLAGQVRAEILIQETPDGGLQPRLVQAADGGIHLLYFKKRLNRPAVREGNLYYREYLIDENRFGPAIKVSSQAFNLQTVAISRAAMAIGEGGRLHVMWYLAREAEYFYARSNQARSQFEPQQTMVEEFRVGIDAGGDIAAFGSQVAIVWGAGELTREAERTMFARFSHDSGSSFGEELRVSNPDLGACACCSLAAEYLEEDRLVIAYRSAIDGIGRHMQILMLNGVSAEPQSGQYQSLQSLQQWEATFCPLSTNDIAVSDKGEHWIVFETEGRIVEMNLLNPEKIALAGEPFIETRQKNPALAFNPQGEKLIAWGEAISHSRGGRLNLRLFDAEGKVTDYELEEELQIADFSFPAAAALPNGDFLVLH